MFYKSIFYFVGLSNICRLELNRNYENKIVITDVYPSLIKTSQEMTAMFTTGM